MRSRTLPEPSSRPDAPARRASPRRSPPWTEGAGALTRQVLVTDFLALCELDPEVEGLRAPAPPARFALEGGETEYVADFEVLRDGVPALVDIVADADLMPHPLRAAAIRGLQAVDGRPFTIETAATLRAEPRYATLKLVLDCKSTPVGAGDRVRILHALDECGTMPLVECARAARGAVDGVAAVLALACERLVSVDINRPILPETQVRRRKVPYIDPFQF